MTTECEQLAIDIRADMVDRKAHRGEMLETLKRLLYRNEAVSESYILKGYTVPNNEKYEIAPVQAAGYERARIFCSLAFDPGASAGIEIDLYFAGHRIGNVLKIGKGAGEAASAGSEPFDINQISGFNLVIRNTDLDQDVIINSMKIILYNQ